jgi:hypothetical protein
MKNLFLLVLSICTLNLSAQKYDFKNYRYRVNGYKILSFTGDLRGSSYFQIEPDVFNNYNNSRSTGNIGSYYSRFRNSEKHIKNTASQINILMDNNISSISSKKRSFNTNFNITTEDLFYRGNKFFSNRVGIYGDVSTLRQDADQELLTNQNRLSGNLRYEVGTGEGRLEYITDPILANFILKDLRQKGVIENFTPEQIESFGKKISQIQSIRMIDYRYRIIDQINMLDTFLKNEIVNGSSSATYFTTLYDNWLYSNRFQRFSGKRNEMLIGNRIGNYRSKQQFETDSNYNQYQFTNEMYIAFEHISEKAIKLSFQKSRTLRAEILRNFANYESSLNSFKNKGTQFNVNFREYFGWYPNTRTFLSTGISTQANYVFNTSFKNQSNPGSWLKNDDMLMLTLSPGINIFYFFSPRLSLNASATHNLNYYKYFVSGSESSLFNNNNFNVRINFTLF